MMRKLHCWGLAAIGALACLGFGLNHAAVGDAAPPASDYASAPPKISIDEILETMLKNELRAREKAEELANAPTKIFVARQIEGDEREAATLAAELLSIADQSSDVRKKETDRLDRRLEQYDFAVVACWTGLIESISADETGNWTVTVSFKPRIVSPRFTDSNWKVIERWEIRPDLRLKLKDAKAVPGFIFRG